MNGYLTLYKNKVYEIKILCGFWMHNRYNAPMKLHATLSAYGYDCPIELLQIVEKQKKYMDVYRHMGNRVLKM